jgi:hypothetical protein
MEESDRKEFISRIGTFFLLIGAGMMVLFIGSDMGASTNFAFFFLSVLGLGLGWYFKRITAPPPKTGGNRFEGLRKLQQKQREAKAKKEAAKKKK